MERSIQDDILNTVSSTSSPPPPTSAMNDSASASACACALLSKRDKPGIGKMSMTHFTESKFGAFGKDPNTHDSHDDSFAMGGEELQIISSHRSSMSHDSWTNNSDTAADYENLGNCERKEQEEDEEDNNDDDDDDDDKMDSFSCVDIVNPLSSTTSSPSRAHQKQDSFTLEGFDICKEYGYRYEYTQDDDSISGGSSSSSSGNSSSKSQSQSRANQNNDSSSFISRLRFKPPWSNDEEGIDPSSRNFQKHNATHRTYLLGKTYHPINDYHARRDDESNLFWFTYRCDFVEIRPYAITSDAGWGCMLRSAQMLLAQVLRMHWKGREWRAERNLRQRREDPFVRSLLTWFADYPFSGCLGMVGGGWGVDSWYSLHNMVAAGCAKYDVLPGEWFGPSTVCYVLRDLVDLHQSYLKKQGRDDKNNDGDGDDYDYVDGNGDDNDSFNDCIHPLKVYIAPEGTIYNADISKLLTMRELPSGNSTNDDAHITEEHSSLSALSHGKQENNEKDIDIDDPKCNHPLSERSATTHGHDNDKFMKDTVEWHSSLLILIPLRLGLEKFNASSYSVPLAHMLSLPQSVGLLGGSPRHALWFYGADSDGRKVYGLDPHTVQRAPRRIRRCHHDVHGGERRRYFHEIVFTDDYLRSINCPNISVMSMKKLDPSLALGFYCRDRKDYESFYSSLQAMKVNEKFKAYPELFTFAEAKPNYEADVSSAMMEMMATCQTLDDEESDRLLPGHVDEDDEYIML